jgi:hypothetical protein
MSKAGYGYRFADPSLNRAGDERKGKLVGKMYASFAHGEGEATLDIAIDNESAMWRVDVLGDIITLLQAEYKKAYEEMISGFDEFRKEKVHSSE